VWPHSKYFARKRAGQVDAMMGAAKEGGHLQKLLSEHTHRQQRQTILASATIPQHRRFLADCVQNKWVKVSIF